MRTADLVVNQDYAVYGSWQSPARCVTVRAIHTASQGLDGRRRPATIVCENETGQLVEVAPGDLRATWVDYRKSDEAKAAFSYLAAREGERNRAADVLARLGAGRWQYRNLIQLTLEEAEALADRLGGGTS
jgi:hypothetical protein